jgi:hypothetical protein
MRGGRNPLLRLYAWLVYAVLFAPIVVLILFSFNDSKRNFVWKGFTLRWYPTLFENDARHDHPRHAARPGAGTPPRQPRVGRVGHADPAADGHP